MVLNARCDTTMKTNLFSLRVSIVSGLLWLATLVQAPAQGTAFTYQGRLNDGTNLATGVYDLQFSLFDAASGGAQQSGTWTQLSQGVSNGLFTVTLDFGSFFPGADRWLEIGVRTNGGGAFTILTPRQKFTATPYAIKSTKADLAVVAYSVPGLSINTNTGSTALGIATTANNYAATAMGSFTTSDGQSSTALGYATWASGNFSTAMGNGSTANGISSTAMGYLSTAGGFAATALGHSTTATGGQSLAAGYRAKALHNGSFVWADLHDADFVTTGTNQFLIRASGGVGINNNNPNGAALAVGGNVNVEGVVSVNALSAASVTASQINGNASGLTDLPVNALSLAGAPTNSSIVAWGWNASGQVTVPTGLIDAAAISAGNHHSMALKRDGTIVVWGSGLTGQTNVPAGLSNVVAISAGGSHSLALRADGTVAGWGNGSVSTPPVGLNNVSAISAGGQHNLALKTDGTVVTWGFNGSGQTNMPPGVTSVAGIAAGGFHSLAVRSNGTVIAWGYNGNGQTNVPAGLSNVKAIAAGYYHSLALRNDGTLVAWGDNSVGQTNIPAGLGNVIAIAAGFAHNLALKADGTLVAWGDNSSGQTNVPVIATHVIAVAPGCAASHVLALVPRVQSPVAWLDADNTFNGNVQFNGVINGKVGINTVPQQVLHVNVPSGLGEGMQIDCATAGHSPAIYLNHTGPSGRNFRLASYGDNSTPGKFIIRDDTAGADRFTIDSTGILTGNGSGLTSLNASSLSSGAVADARLTANVALRAGGNNFTGLQTFTSGSVRVNGNDNWDVNNNEGDFRVGTDTQRFKIGVAQSGGGAGDVWMRAQGGTARVFIKTPGGTTFYSNEGQTAGVSLAAGGGAWTTVSDRNAKENFKPVNPTEVLEKVAALPLSNWNYKAQDANIRHLGPMAQDFKAAFGLGESDTGITTVDADGVALAAIQGLNQKLETENAELKVRLEKLERLVESLAPKK